MSKQCMKCNQFMPVAQFYNPNNKWCRGCHASLKTGYPQAPQPVQTRGYATVTWLILLAVACAISFTAGTVWLP